MAISKIAGGATLKLPDHVSFQNVKTEFIHLQSNLKICHFSNEMS